MMCAKQDFLDEMKAATSEDERTAVAEKLLRSAGSRLPTGIEVIRGFAAVLREAVGEEDALVLAEEAGQATRAIMAKADTAKTQAWADDVVNR